MSHKIVQGKSKRRNLKSRERRINWALTLISALVTFVLLIVADNHQVPHKWVTATVSTIAPFAFALYAFRSQISQWSFWLAFSICLTLHCLIFFLVFQFVLSGVQSISPLLLSPVMVIEFFVLLIVVKRLEQRLSGQRSTMKLHL